MNTNTATEIRQRLQARKTELADRLNRIRRDRMHTDAPLSPDFAEQAVQRENDEVLDRLEAATQSDLAQTHHALVRLTDGYYGVCEVCGFPIESERLAAVPQATRCMSCAGPQQARAA